LLFTLGVSVFTGFLFGLVPAISASRPNLAAALVVSEMALAVILVIGAALLIRTFLKLEAVDPGFETHNVLTIAMSVSEPLPEDRAC
jgi:hypothetical protein